MSLYITTAQPNPPGRDTARFGIAGNDQLNAEWIEFQAQASRDLVNDVLTHLTFDNTCRRTGADQLITFSSFRLQAGESVRVHTGRGQYYREGVLHHVFLDRGWFVWNNRCGDRGTLAYGGSVIDSPYYDPNPPEGVLTRVPGTDRLTAGAYRRYA